MLRGPVTTSFGHFNTTDPKTASDPSHVDPMKFHTLEDQGFPPALATLIGCGGPFIRSLAAGRRGLFWVVIASLRFALRRLGHYWTAFWNNFRQRQDIPKNPPPSMPAVIPIVRPPDDPGIDDDSVTDEFAEQVGPPQHQAGGWRGFLSRWGG